MKTDLPKRKVIRLENYDYRRNGCYFITICASNKAHLFGEIVSNTMVNSQIGAVAFDELKLIEKHHENTKVLNSVIMPNHIHIILSIEKTTVSPGESEYNSFSKALRGSVSTIVGSYKSAVSKAVHMVENSVTARSDPTKVWQTRFYEHVIRNDDDYFRIWQYIDENPQKWNGDCYFK